MHEMRAQLADFLGLYRPVDIVGDTNPKKAFKRLCKGLYEIGVTAAMVRQKKEEIINLFESQLDTANAFRVLVGNFSGEEARNILTENRNGNLAGFDHQWIF